VSDTSASTEVSTEASPEEAAIPVTKCGACGQSDDHPKHQIAVGFNNVSTGGQMFHEHDFARDGCIYYHFDCPTEWHGVPQDPRHREAMEKAASGVHGDELRTWIMGGTE
jgi:hypothetical protein